MTYEDIVLIDTVSRNSLQAATAVDRLVRGVECDTGAIKTFLSDLAEVYGPIPPHIIEGLEKRDEHVLALIRIAALGLHDKALSMRPTGPFENLSFEELLKDSKPVSAQLLAEINDLVGDMEVDLDEKIDGPVSI